MERGASYSLHEDTEMVAKTHDASGYQPPNLQQLTHRGVAMPQTRTGRIIDRADTLFQRSKGRWKYVVHYALRGIVPR